MVICFEETGIMIMPCVSTASGRNCDEGSENHLQDLMQRRDNTGTQQFSITTLMPNVSRRSQRRTS